MTTFTMRATIMIKPVVFRVSTLQLRLLCARSLPGITLTPTAQERDCGVQALVGSNLFLLQSPLHAVRSDEREGAVELEEVLMIWPQKLQPQPVARTLVSDSRRFHHLALFPV